MSLLVLDKVACKATGDHHTGKESRLLLALLTSNEVGRADPPVSHDDPNTAFHFTQKSLASHPREVEVLINIGNGITITQWNSLLFSTQMVNLNSILQNNALPKKKKISFGANFTVNTF